MRDSGSVKLYFAFDAGFDSSGSFPYPHPSPPAPASSCPSPASAVTSAGTALPAPSGVTSENPRWSGNLVDYRPPTHEKQRLPPNASGSCATKIPPRNTHRAGSWSSCADDTAVAPDHPLHTRTRSPKGSTGPPRPTRNKPSGHPATIRAGSEVKANLVQAGRFGMFSSWFRIIRTPPHYFSSEFSRTKDEFSDKLLDSGTGTGVRRDVDGHFQINGDAKFVVWESVNANDFGEVF